MGRLSGSGGAINEAARDGSTYALVSIARLKRRIHQVVPRPGTRPSNVASQARSPGPAPGATRPAAISKGLSQDCTPTRQRTGKRAAICVPTANDRQAENLLTGT